MIQSVDGRFTLAGIFTNMFAADLPISRVAGVLVEFTGEVGDPFRISIEGPAGADLTLVLADGVLETPTLRHPQEQWSAKVGGMVGIQFPIEGIYRVILASGDSIVHEYPFAVIKAAPAQPAPAQTVV